MGVLTRAVRNISRHKVRALLVTIALGFCMAIMVSIPAGITANQKSTVTLTQNLGNTISQTEATINQTLTQIECTLSHRFEGFSFAPPDSDFSSAPPDGDSGLARAKVTYGWLIAQVTSGGPADTAGIQGGTKQVAIAGEYVVIGGDIVIALDGTRIKGIDDLSTFLEECASPGQLIDTTIIRNGVTVTLPVTLGTRP